MRVKFRDNLGSRDAEGHSLDFRECLHGTEHDVPDAVGRILVHKGIATEVAQDTPKAKVMPAVETPAEIKAIPDSPSIKADTTPARGAAKKPGTPQKDEQ